MAHPEHARDVQDFAPPERSRYRRHDTVNGAVFLFDPDREGFAPPPRERPTIWDWCVLAFFCACFVTAILGAGWAVAWWLG